MRFIQYFRAWGALAACLAVLLFHVKQSAGAPKWTDRNEYDLVLAVRAEAAPQKRLALLDQWKAKYPKTELRQTREELYLSVYQSLGDSQRMLASAREMISGAPDNLVGLYWYTLLAPEAKEAPAELLDTGEKAARRLLAGLDTYFAAGGKPAGTAADAWQKRRVEVEFLAHRALGWIQWQRADYPGAAAEFTTCLHQDPNRAEISAWFGIVLAQDKDPAHQVPALWHLARAASYRGSGALPDAQRRQLSPVLERLYTTYHGETAGLDQVRIASVAAAFPPAGFAIESASAAALRRQDEELSRTNPQLASWLGVRRHLEAADGEAYFAETLHNKSVPMRWKGTLIRSTPPRKPQELVLGVGDATAEEVILKLDTAFPNEAEPGAILEFEGTAEAFTKAPFTLTVLADREKIEGWPAARSRK
jgi:tetratricopeptide (TPR) repeat protein